MKNKKVNKKLLALFSTLILALTSFSASFLIITNVCASNNYNEELQQLFINKYNNEYFDNNFNYTSKLSNTTVELFDTSYSRINFGIDYYTYNNLINNGIYNYFSENVLTGVLQASSSGNKVVYYNNVTSYYMKINFKNIVIPCVYDNTSDFKYLSGDLFATSLNSFLSDLYLYCGNTSLTPIYSIEYTLLLYDKVNDFTINYNNDISLLSSYFINTDNQYTNLSNIFTYDILLESFNSIDTINYDVQMPYENFNSLCSANYILNNYSYYYIIPNLSIAIDTQEEIPSIFYCINNMYNNLGANCVYDYDFLQYLNTFAVSNQLPTNYFNVYYSGYLNGFNNGQRDANNFKTSFEDLIWSVIDAPIQTINKGFNFEIFGINFANAIKVILSILIVGFCVKLLL